MYKFNAFGQSDSVFSATSVNVGIAVIPSTNGLDLNERAAAVKDKLFTTSLHPMSTMVLNQFAEARLQSPENVEAFQLMKANQDLVRKSDINFRPMYWNNHFEPINLVREWESLKSKRPLDVMYSHPKVNNSNWSISSFAEEYGLKRAEPMDVEYGVPFYDYQQAVNAVDEAIKTVKIDAHKGTSR